MADFGSCNCYLFCLVNKFKNEENNCCELIWEKRNNPEDDLFYALNDIIEDNIKDRDNGTYFIRIIGTEYVERASTMDGTDVDSWHDIDSVQVRKNTLISDDKLFSGE